MKAPLLSLVVAYSLSTLLSSAHAELIAGWDFQGTTAAGAPIGTVISQPPTTPRVFTANAGVFQATSHLYFDGSNGSSSFVVGTINGDSELGSLNGITANTEGTLFSTATGSGMGGGSIALFNREAHGGIDGKSAVFRFSMSGYEDLQFSFAVQRPSSSTDDYGVSLFTFSYSTDGAVFFPWGSIDTGAGMLVSNTAFSMASPLSAVNDAEVVYLKMTFSGSTNGINSTRIDNIQLNATVIPEPGALCGLMGGLAVLLSSRRSFRRTV